MFNFLNTFLLSSPFEGFKTQAYYLHLLQGEYFNPSIFWKNQSIINNYDFFEVIEASSSSKFLIISLFTFYSILSLSNFVKNTFVSDNTFDKIKETSFSIIFAGFISVFILNSQSILKEGIVLLGSNDSVYTFYGLKSEFLMLTVQEYWCLSSSLIAFYLLSSKSLTNLKLYSSTFLDGLSENFYNFTFDLFSDILGLKTVEEVKKHQVFFFKIYAVFFFNVFSNLGGMIPFSVTFTSQLFVTFSLAYLVFIACTYTIIAERGMKYFFSLFMPQGISLVLAFLLVPIEMVSYSFRVISLGVRLFVNIMAGHVLLKVIAGFAIMMIVAGDFMILASFFPVIILIILTVLELAIALIQAYVFTVLTLLYLRDFFVAH